MLRDIDRESHLKEDKPISDQVKVAYNILILQHVSIEDLIKATGLPGEKIEAEMKGLKRDVGGVKGSAKNGYTLVEDAEARLALSRWVSLNL